MDLRADDSGYVRTARGPTRSAGPFATSGEGDATHRYVGSSGSSAASAGSGSRVTGPGTSPSSANSEGAASTGSV